MTITANKDHKYTLRFADRSRPDFFEALPQIAERYDFPGFDPAEYADTAEVNVELRDEDGSVIAWIMPVWPRR